MIESITLNSGLLSDLIKKPIIAFNDNLNVIIGKNGCGKSTLLALLFALEDRVAESELTLVALQWGLLQV